MDEFIRPEDVLGARLCTLYEYATWMSSENRAWLVRHLGITEVAEMDKEKEKAMNSIFGAKTTAQELAREAEKQFGTSIGVGTQVRDAMTKEYLGKIVQVETVVYATIETRDGDRARVNVARIEVAPKLTPEQAWSQLPLDIVKRLVDLKRLPGMMNEFAYTALRRECYVLLGGAGVKVTEDVKERVRSTIETLSRHLGIRII